MPGFVCKDFSTSTERAKQLRPPPGLWKPVLDRKTGNDTMAGEWTEER
jgi:hypothetical protein